MMQKQNIPKQLLSSILSLVVVVALLGVSLVAFSGMNKSTAWFSMNNKVTADGFSVMVSDPQEIHVTLTSYAVSSINNNVYTLSADQLYTLPIKDRQNILYNDYQKALVVVLEISSKKNQKVTINLTTPNSDFSKFNYNTSPNVFSNCMQITYATLATANGVTTATAEGTPQSFVTVNDENLSKTGTLSLLPPEKNPITITGGAAPVQYCFIIEYNARYTDYIFQKVSNVITMPFNHDITFEVTSTESVQ